MKICSHFTLFLNKDDVVVPSPDELTERVLAAHHIREKDGELECWFYGSLLIHYAYTKGLYT